MIQINQYYTTSFRTFLGIIRVGMFLWVANPVCAQDIEWIEACVWDHQVSEREFADQASTCLGWQVSQARTFCRGTYSPIEIDSLPDPNSVQLKADQVLFSPAGQSDFQGHVQIQQNQSIITARTAQVYRDPNTQQIKRIALHSNVHFMEPGHLMIAKDAWFNPQDKSGYVQKVMYRFDMERHAAKLPAWGTAEWIKRFSNQDYDLHAVTYTTCSPRDSAWDIRAKNIYLDHAKQTGVAQHALLRLGKVPILYTPYLSFPTNSQRKSGFLMPYGGYSNSAGFDFAVPYYLNLAPNYDATLVPHYYTLRGWMLGGTTRFLTERSTGVMGGAILPHDSTFKNFIDQNVGEFPVLQGSSSDRWSVFAREQTRILPNLNLNIDFQQVSDDYYLQDFNTNLAISSENQLLRQGSLVYTTEHWLFAGMAQSYQTLRPVNQSFVADIYERLPQVLANGTYHDLAFHSDLDILGQFDYFRWPGMNRSIPQGSRYHFNPILSMPHVKPWGYFTPNAEVVENNYDLFYNLSSTGQGHDQSATFNRVLPRGYVDAGLTFERDNAHLFSNRMRQTLEPRLFYLYVPYENQSQFPAFDSAYMIFNTDQLFRTNRFSGFDRISDANQLSYAVTTRWLSPNSGQEKAKLTVGQIRYFSPRKVQLCYNNDGQCTDSLLFLGSTSPDYGWSPVAMSGDYKLNSSWWASTGYVWDPAANSTNNANLNLHYQPDSQRIINFGYNYLTSGNVIALPEASLNSAPLNQFTAAYAWPFNENWSSLGVYSYNLSEQYDMLAFFGVQYDTCCWAVRMLGGRTFKSLTPNATIPEYNNNVYLQILLKGLGSVASSNPETTIQSYLPGYRNIFHR